MSDMRIILTASAFALLSAMPGLAASKFAAPKGCTVYQTVQMRGCQVAQLYHCEGDPQATSGRSIWMPTVPST